MKIALLLNCYNRPEYLTKTLWSLKRADISQLDEILIIDDCSSDNGTLKLLRELQNITVQYNTTNQGICKNLLHGYEALFAQGFTHVINLDSDALFRPELFSELIKHYIPNTLLTGFHSTNKNRNGTERHRIISETESLYFKESVGGINFIIDKAAYENFVKSALIHCINYQGNFDYISCVNAGGAYCLKQSLIEHIGFDSSLNHHENPDVADSFHYFDLPNVTLLCVDNEPDRIQEPLRKCTEQIKFGNIVLLHPDIRSKEQYSNFMIYESYKHINTSHVMVFQYDGYVNNWQAWDDKWLRYDYIGAPWHYTDGLNVGNGGFSLRSKRLMEILATDKTIQHFHPEDHHICRTYRPYLEQQYGIKFAPKEVAERFAFEGYLQPDKVLKDQFGRHGTNPRTTIATPIKTDRLVFNQFLSLGDILFLIPMARALMQEGNEVLWPIDDRYLPIAKHFPDIRFVAKSAIPINYEYKGVLPTAYGKLLPYRFASELRGKTLHSCMESKYLLYGHDWKLWRQLYWNRDRDNERRLCELLELPPHFILVNRYFGHLGELQINPKIESELPIIEMRNIPGFTIIDWLGVVERSMEVHASNSSLNYLLELMDLKIPVYLYKRGIWGEQGFEYTRHLWENKNFIFVE